MLSSSPIIVTTIEQRKIRRVNSIVSIKGIVPKCCFEQLAPNLVAIQFNFFSISDDSDKPQPNFSTNLISDIEFNENGTELWISCKDSCLIVIDTNDWYVMKNVSPEDFPITQLQMLPAIQIQSIRHKSVTNFSIGHINAVDKLAFLTEYANDGTIDVQPFTPWKCASIKRFTCSPDCKILAVIQTDGTLKLYSIEYLMRQVFQMKFTPQPTQLDQICSKITENLKEFDKNVRGIIYRKQIINKNHQLNRESHRSIIFVKFFAFLHQNVHFE